jgi:hypothetical protein
MTMSSGESRPGREAIVRVVRQTVWNAHFGVKAEHGSCFVCHSRIRQDDFAIGHYEDGVTGGKAQVNNMRPICQSCDRVLGKTSIVDYLRSQPVAGVAERPDSKPAETDKEKRTENRRWFDNFTEALWYSNFDIPNLSGWKLPNIDLPDFQFPDIDWPDIDWPDIDFDFDW